MINFGEPELDQRLLPPKFRRAGTLLNLSMERWRLPHNFRLPLTKKQEGRCASLGTSNKITHQ